MVARKIVGSMLVALIPSVVTADDPCPVELEWWGNPWVSAAAATDGRVVAVDRTAGLRVFESSPTDPLLEVGLLPELETTEELAAAGDIVVAVTGSALYVVSIADPSNPRRLGPRITGSPNQVAISGSYAFSHLSPPGAETLRVVDLGDPTQPTVAAEMPLTDAEGNAMRFLSDLAVVGPLLVAVGETEPDACNFDDDWWEGEYALVTIDIRDPAHPRILGSANLGCWWVSSVAIAGRWAYAVHPYPNSTVFQIIDLVRPATPEVVVESSSAIPRDCWYLAIAGGRLLVGQRDEQFSIQHVYELTDPLQPALVGSFPTRGMVFEPAVEDDVALVPFGPSGLAALGLDGCPAAGPPAPRRPTERLRAADQQPARN